MERLIITFADLSKLKWKDAEAKKDMSYEYANTRFLYDDECLYFKLTTGYRVLDNKIYYSKAPKGAKKIPPQYITIKNYKYYTALEVLAKLEEYYQRTRMTEDFILHFYNENGLDLGYTKKILRPLIK